MKIASTFQYSNVYVVTPHINKLYEDKKLQEDCIKYVAKSGKFCEFLNYTVFVSLVTTQVITYELLVKLVGNV